MPYAASVFWPVSGHLALKFLLYALEDCPHSLTRYLFAPFQLFKPSVAPPFPSHPEKCFVVFFLI